MANSNNTQQLEKVVSINGSFQGIGHDPHFNGTVELERANGTTYYCTGIHGINDYDWNGYWNA